MNNWLVVQVTVTPCRRGDIEAQERIIGYSDHKQAKELFSILEQAYPKVPIRRRIEGTSIYVDKEGTENLPYVNFIYFEWGSLIKF